MDSRPRLCAGMTEGEALHGMTGKGRVGLKPTPTMENVGGGWSRGTPLREEGGWRWEGCGFDSEGGW